MELPVSSDGTNTISTAECCFWGLRTWRKPTTLDSDHLPSPVTPARAHTFNVLPSGPEPLSTGLFPSYRKKNLPFLLVVLGAHSRHRFICSQDY